MREWVILGHLALLAVMCIGGVEGRGAEQVSEIGKSSFLFYLYLMSFGKVYFCFCFLIERNYLSFLKDL